MKKNFLIILSSILLFSCSNNEIVDENMLTESNDLGNQIELSKSENECMLIESNELKDELADSELESEAWDYKPPILIGPKGKHICVMGGISGDRYLLSSNHDGKRVDLWMRDDNSGRQRWNFKHLGGGYYNIIIAGGVSSDRKYLSTSKDGDRVDLWPEDDGSGRQKWKLVKFGTRDIYHIEIYGGVKGKRYLLSVRGDGQEADLYHYDDFSGRQQWTFSEVPLTTNY